MPGKPFSGKQKKQQLQEKRAKKREKEANQRDSDDSAASDAQEQHYERDQPKHETKETAKSTKKQDQTGTKGNQSNPKEAAVDVYGGDKKGVRSEFKKEQMKEVKERQKANYAPLVEREFINADVGIPFGQWFKVSNVAAGRKYSTVVDGVTMGISGYSSTFLYSIALPRRARMSGEDGKDIFACNDDDSDDYDQGPRGGRGGRGRGRGGRGGKAQTGRHESTDDSTTTSEDENGTPSTSSDTETTPSAADAPNAKIKAVKARLKAASEYDVRERHVFRHWMNAIDRNFGDTHDAANATDTHETSVGYIAQPHGKSGNGEEESKADNDTEDIEGVPQEEEGPKKQKRIGRRNRAVDKANNPQEPRRSPVHPLANLELNLFERNIDVWRQMWRTVENSDVVVAVADARYPTVHLPLSLFMHVIGEYSKPVVVVLNKADLLKDAMLAKWEHFLRSFWDTALKPLLPPEKRSLVDQIAICRFTCSPEAGTALAKDDEQATSRRKKKAPRNAKLYEELKAGESKKGQSAYAPSRKEMRGHRFDYTEGKGSGSDDDDEQSDSSSNSDDLEAVARAKAKSQENVRKELIIVKEMINTILNVCKRKGLGLSKDTAVPLPADHPPIHIGFVGHPNVGKSSLINCIKGSKVVSVSATAGHTKHLQTVPLLADGVVLIDCPGLAFPVLGLPKPMQAVLGTHQIAQTRDPQSGVGYLGARLQLERIYQLKRLDNDDTEPWSAYELCESYGHKKGYHVKKGKGAIDVHRAAIALLAEAYDGRLVLAFAPPADEYLSSDAFKNTVSKYLYLDPEWAASAEQDERHS